MACSFSESYFWLDGSSALVLRNVLVVYVYFRIRIEMRYSATVVKIVSSFDLLVLFVLSFPPYYGSSPCLA